MIQGPPCDGWKTDTPLNFFNLKSFGERNRVAQVCALVIDLWSQKKYDLEFPIKSMEFRGTSDDGKSWEIDFFSDSGKTRIEMMEVGKYLSSTMGERDISAYWNFSRTSIGRDKITQYSYKNPMVIQIPILEGASEEEEEESDEDEEEKHPTSRRETIEHNARSNRQTIKKKRSNERSSVHRPVHHDNYLDKRSFGRKLLDWTWGVDYKKALNARK